MDDRRFHDVTTFHRSSVHILLADRDSQTRKEVFELLRRCSYKVTAVESAKHVLEVLRAGGPAVDVILSEVEFPHGKGLKLLKHIMREEKLKQIPVVMMSQRDEMTLVVKSLRLGAADYLVKPLRTNELLNLWTHMWRRRRMLGMADRLSGHPNMNGPPLDLAFSDTSDSNSGSVDMLSNETAGERRTRLEGQVNEDNERDRDEMRSQVSPVLSLSLKPSSDGVEIQAKGGYEMLPPSRKVPHSSPHRFRTPLAPPPGTFHNPKRLRGGEESHEGFAAAARAAPEQSSGESHSPHHQTARIQKFLPSSAWHPIACPQHSAPSGSSAAPHSHRSAEGLTGWGAPRVNQHPPGPELYNGGVLMHSRSQELQQRAPPQGSGGNHMGRRDSLPHDFTRAQHAGGVPNVGNKPPVTDYHRGAFQGDGQGQQSQEGPWQNAFRPPYFTEPQYANLVPSSGGGMAQMPPPHYYMHPHNQGGNREPSKPEFSSGGVSSREERPQGFGMPPQLPNGMQLPSDLLMNPHLAMFNLGPEMLPLMNLPPDFSSLLTGGLMGQMPFPPFFQNMLNPHMICPPPSAPTPPPQATPPQKKPPQARAQFSPPPQPTGVPAPANGVPVGNPPVPMWPVLQAGVDRKMDQAERREAALSKFRQKRRDRCFAKKIRYASRKKLAEARPRVKGQFVRRTDGAPPGGGPEADEEDLDDEEEEEDEVEEEDLDEENKSAQLPDISSSLNGSNDSQSAVNKIESR